VGEFQRGGLTPEDIRAFRAVLEADASFGPIALGIPEKPNTFLPETQRDPIAESDSIDHSIVCPVCRKGRMAVVETIRADRIQLLKLTGFLVRDTW